MKINLTDLLKQAEEGYLIPCYNKFGEINLFARATTGDSLLHVAVGRRNIGELRYLLDKKLDINLKGDYFATPLYQAAANGDVGMVGLLLILGADPSIPDHRGDLPKDVLFRKIGQLPESFLEDLLIWCNDKLPN
jgi:ankyrin repeat protein